VTSPATPHVANIGESGQQRRRLGGYVWLLVGIAMSAWFLARGVSLWWYLLLVLPFTLAAVGVLQAKEKT
jgi:hypothetical protein